MSLFNRYSRPWILAVLLFVTGMLVLLSPLLALRVEPKWDAIHQFLPAFTYLADSLRQGGFPLWDPFTNCGYPYHAEPQFNTFNPLALGLALIVERPSLGFVCFWVGHWVWGGVGMMRLGRHFGASAAGALAAAFAYALCGFFIGHAQHTSYIVVAAWLPWIFVYADKAVAHSSGAFALLAGAAIGFGSYGGYPGLILFTLLALAIWLGLRYLPRPAEPGRRSLGNRGFWILSTLAVVGGLLLVIWSPVLNAFLVEGKGYTDRVGQLDPATANFGHPFTLSAAVSLLFPYATIVGREWMGADISMTNGYMGILTIPLAVFWFLKCRGARRPWWLLIFVGFMLLVSLGGEYGLRSLLYHVFPPLRYMRFSAPFRLFWMLPLILAAGLAVSHLARYPEDRGALLKLLLAWCLGAGAVAAAFSRLAPVPEIQLQSLAPRLFLPGLLILAVATALIWLFSRTDGWRRTAFLPTLLVLLVFADMATHLYNNAGTVWSSGKGVEHLEKSRRPLGAFGDSVLPRLPGRPFGYLNAQQVVKVPLVQGYVTMQTEGFNQILVNSRYAEVLSAPFRFWLTPGIEQATVRESALATLAQAGVNGAVPVFAEKEIGSLPKARVVPGSFGSVEVRSYTPERVELAVQVPGSNPAFLASTERYAAGWHVFVNGAAQKVWKANFYFRGAVVPPGNHRVVWEYRPQRLYPLLTASYLALAGAFGGALFLLLRRRGDGQG